MCQQLELEGGYVVCRRRLCAWEAGLLGVRMACWPVCWCAGGWQVREWVLGPRVGCGWGAYVSRVVDMLVGRYVDGSRHWQVYV